jgi:hypothetical protein
MQILKNWLNQSENFFNKHFKEYYLASFCWWIPSSCENHCNLMNTNSVGSGIGAARCGGLTLRKLIAAVEDKRLGQPGHRKVTRNRQVPRNIRKSWWAVFQIRDILVPYGSGSSDPYIWRTDPAADLVCGFCSFRQWTSRCQSKIGFFSF